MIQTDVTLSDPEFLKTWRDFPAMSASMRLWEKVKEGASVKTEEPIIRGVSDFFVITEAGPLDDDDEDTDEFEGDDDE